MKAFWLLLLAIICAGCGAKTPPQIDPNDTTMVLAQKNYDTYCAHCHGITGGGQPDGTGPGTHEFTRARGYNIVPRHDGEGETWRHPEQLIFETIKWGTHSPLNLYVMSAYGDTLDDDAIWGLVEYIKLFWTPQQREHQAKLTAQFAEIRDDWETYNLDIYLTPTAESPQS